MTKQLTFSEATLGWRFAHTEIFLKHFIKQWELLQDVQIKNLDEFWNITDAVGLWLRELGAIFHVPNPQVIGDDAFVLDIDMMDIDSVVLDGTLADLADEMYRKVILIRSISTMKLFSMKNIADAIYQAFGEDQVKVEFRENTDVMGNPKPMYFRLLLTFKDPEIAKLFAGMQESLPNILIGKPMGVSYDVFVTYDPTVTDIHYYGWKDVLSDSVVYTLSDDPNIGDELFDNSGESIALQITSTWKESEIPGSTHYIIVSGVGTFKRDSSYDYTRPL